MSLQKIFYFSFALAVLASYGRMIVDVINRAEDEDHSLKRSEDSSAFSRSGAVGGWSRYLTGPIVIDILQFYAFAVFYHLCCEQNGRKTGVLPMFGFLQNTSVMAGLLNSAVVTFFLTYRSDYWLFVSNYVMSQPFIILPQYIMAFCQWGPYYLRDVKVKKSQGKSAAGSRFLLWLASLAPHPTKPGCGFLKVIGIFFVPVFIYMAIVLGVFYSRFRDVGYDQFFDLYPSIGEQSALVVVMFVFFVVFLIVALAMHIHTIVMHTRALENQLHHKGKKPVFETVFGLQGTLQLIFTFIMLVAFIATFFHRMAVYSALVTQIMGLGSIIFFVVPEALTLIYSRTSCAGVLCCVRGGRYKPVGTRGQNGRGGGEEIDLNDSEDEEGDSDSVALMHSTWEKGKKVDRGQNAGSAARPLEEYETLTATDFEKTFISAQTNLGASKNAAVKKLVPGIVGVGSYLKKLEEAIQKNREPLDNNPEVRGLVEGLVIDDRFKQFFRDNPVLPKDPKYPIELLVSLNIQFAVSVIMADAARVQAEVS